MLASRQKKLAGTAVRFGVVGVLTAVIHYGLLVLTVTCLQWETTAASSVGFVVAVSFNYFMHYGWTFAPGPEELPSPHGRTLLRYLVMIACGFVINGGLMFLSVHVIGLHYLLAQLPSTTATPLFSHQDLNTHKLASVKFHSTTATSAMNCASR